MALVVPRSGNEYRVVNGHNVAEMPYSQGIALPGETGLIRPFNIVAMGQLATVRALAGGREQIDIPLVEVPGLTSTGAIRAGETILAQYPIASFRYYKPGGDGAVESQRRIVALCGFGYGVHPGHIGEEPTWYIRGEHLGNSSVDETGAVIDTTYLPLDQVEEKHFSMARVVGGPLGDPLTDAAHRERWAIPEIATPLSNNT